MIGLSLVRRWWKPRQRPATHAGQQRLLLEFLESRTVPSVYDGSFQAIGLTSLRSDPSLSGINGKGIGIADLDTGVYGQNPDIQPNLVAWYDAVGTAEGTPTTQAFDPNGHGTHTAGIEAASDPNIGVAPGASLIAVRTIPTAGYDNTQQLYQDPIALALQWVLDNHQQYNILVVNMSFGDPTTNVNTPQPFTTGEPALIGELEAAGITVVASSGNNYAQNADGTANELGEAVPSVYATLSVANTWGDVSAPNTPVPIPLQLEGNPPVNYIAAETAATTDTLSASSQRSTLPNQVAAPGDGIVTDSRGNQYIGVYSTWNLPNQLFNVDAGTSMAAPMVTGTVALMQQAAIQYGGTALPPAQIQAILESTADTVTDTTNPNDFRVPLVNGVADIQGATALPATGLTFKRINAYAAVKEVIREVTAPSTGGGSGSTDTDSTIATADVLPAIDGTKPALTITANIGKDGSVQVGPNDVDLYQVTLQSPGTFFALLNPVSGGQSFTAELRVFDSSGTELGAIAGTAGNGYPGLQGLLNAGTYYVGVSSAGNNTYNVTNGTGAANGQTTGDYTLTVELQNPDPNGVITGALPFAGIPNVYNGIIGSDPNPNDPTNPNDSIQVGPQDVDMFQVVAPDTGDLLIWTNSTAYGFLAVDTYLRVFDAQGNQLAADDDSPVAGANPTDSSLAVPVVKGQTVYVAVSDAANAGYDPTNPFNRSALGTGGYYTLFMDFDNGDMDGTIFNAVPTTIGSTVQGSIGYDNGNLVGADGSKDVDFVKFTPSQSGVLDVAAASQTNGFTPVLSLWTYNPGTTTTAASATKIADTSSTQSPELLYQVQAGQDYYLAVTGLGNSDFLWYATASGTGGETGNYTLTSSLLPLTTLAARTDNAISDGGVQSISVGQTIAGNLGMDGNVVVGPTDVDLYRFVAPATETIDVTTQTTAEGSADTFLRIFDQSGNELAYNDNASPDTTGSEVRIQVQAGQTYYFGIDGAIGLDGTDDQARAYNPVTGAGAAASTSLGNYLLSVTLSKATRLVVTTAPATVGAGNPFSLMVSAEDVAGNVDPTFTGNVTLTLANPGSNTLSGTLTVAASAGVATFSGLTLSQTGNGTVIQAAATGLTTATATFNVGLAPTANAQSVGVSENTATSITLTATDPDTAPLPLTWSITTLPAHGMLTGTAPNLTYTPTAGYVGPDSFQFKVNNGTLYSNLATVSITVEGPLGVALMPVIPNPRSTAVGSLLITFSAPVTGFTLGNLQLRGPGGSNVLTAAQTLTTTDNLTWTLGNLAGLTNPTHRVAGFTLTLNPAGITDAAGDTLDGSIATAFTVVDPILTLQGTTLDIPGTGSSDVFTFTAGPSEQATLDGVTYAIDPTIVSTVSFQGKGGTAILTAAGSDNSAALTLGSGTLQGAGYAFNVNGITDLYVDGGSTDSAAFSDTFGSNTFIGTPTYSYLSNVTKLSKATGFATVVATAGASATDTALLSDTSGSNTFVGTPAYSYLTIGGAAPAFIKVVGFKAVQATAAPGSADTADLNDVSGNNLFLATPFYSYLVAGTFVETIGFSSVVATAAKGTSDAAYYYDTAGSHRFVATPGYSYLSGTAFDEAIGFTHSVAIAPTGGKDSATLYGSTGNDTFIGAPNYSYLVGAGVTNEVVGFISVVARTAGGNDSATLYDGTGSNEFVATPAYAALTGAGYANEVVGFTGGVTARGTAGNADVAYLYGSSAGDDRFVGTPTDSYLSGTGFLNQVVGFGTVWGYSQGPGDVAYLFDSANGDTFAGLGSLASLLGTNYDLDVEGFTQVIAYGAASGVNHLSVGAVNYLFSTVGNWM